MTLEFDRQRLARTVMLGVVICGSVIAISSLQNLPNAGLGLKFLLLFALTIAVGPQITLKIPSFKSTVSIADTFIFLGLLVFGGEAAILIGITEALVSSLRITKRALTASFNAAAIACSTFVTVSTVRLLFGKETDILRNSTWPTLILATCLMAAVQYAVNSGLVAFAGALRADKPILQTWRKYYLWSSVSYFAGALAAGLIAWLDASAGLHAIAALLPVIGVVYFTYSTYLKNQQASLVQAEQVQRHTLELKESEERFRDAFDHAPIGMAMVTTDGCWLQVNRSLCEILGYSEEELAGANFKAITHPEDLEQFARQVAKVLAGEMPAFQTEKRYVHKEGGLVWVLASVTLIHDTESNSPHLIFQIQDITARKLAEEQMLYDAFHDGLTGLPNRAWFMDRLSTFLEQEQRSEGGTFAVLFLDLDRFKVINDSLGHIFGDQLLMGIAHRLRNCVRPQDTVARLGGDEFTILLKGVSDAGDAVRIAERLQRQISQPFKLGGYDAFTTASIGIAMADDRYVNPEEILRDADTAMYHAKSGGRAQYVIFDACMHARAMSILQIETDLRRAIEHQDFELHYQPIVDLITGSLNGFEALVRWRHPERGLVPAGEFIPVAEETGLIVPLGEWVLREACSQANFWQAIVPDHPPLSIAVNLSIKQFTYSHLIDHIMQTLDATGLDPCTLKLEITESVVMDNVETSTRKLQQLRSLGIELSIDDFGTGYSSLSYLHRLPIDTLKIDRSFVSSLNENDENREIVRTILTLAKTLRKNVIAEGVETVEQLELLKSFGCNQAQGFLFSKPVPASEATRLIERMSGWRDGTLGGDAREEQAPFPSLVSPYAM